MTEPGRHTYRYAIDARDVISEVSAAWLEFARENGASELTRKAVVGRPLWDFVAGEETRRLYELVFARVRMSDAPVVLPFRCDSPERFRFMRLMVSHRAEGVIDFAGHLIREQDRPYFPILDKAFPRSERRLRMCSFCRRILVFEREWLEPEDAIVRLDLFATTRPPRIDEAVCHRCDEAVRTAVGAA